MFFSAKVSFTLAFYELVSAFQRSDLLILFVCTVKYQRVYYITFRLFG